MIHEVAYDNAHIINVESGRNTLDNLQNVEGVGGRSTAAKNVKRVHGFSTDIGVLLHLNDVSAMGGRTN